MQMQLVPKICILLVYLCLFCVLVFPLNAQQSTISTLINILLHVHDVNVVQNTFFQYGNLSFLFFQYGNLYKILTFD